LGLEDVYVNNLYEDISDGVLLNKVIHVIDDKVVEWKNVDLKPNNDFKKNINNNTAIAACKLMGMKMIGVGGVDITKKDKKNILAVVW
jgi:plastin-1